jgi:DNA excision repair protein ERCC-2
MCLMVRLRDSTSLETKPLKFAYTRLNSLLRTLEVTHLDEYNPLQVRPLGRGQPQCRVAV